MGFKKRHFVKTRERFTPNYYRKMEWNGRNEIRNTKWKGTKKIKEETQERQDEGKRKGRHC